MKVILIENVKGTGKKDEIKEVKDGFGSFLIKSKKAVLYSEKSKEVLSSQIEDRKNALDALIKDCTKTKEKLEKLNLVFQVKSGKDGKVFGSISSKQISEELAKNNISVDKKIIKAENLNTLGTHIIEVALHKTVVANLKITLKGGE